MLQLASIKPNIKKALFLANKQLTELVCDAVNLEGIHYTLPEIQTLLGGITVGGHKLNDQQIALNQADAWRYLFTAIENQQFSLAKSFACQLHAHAAKEEALIWGRFREGQVTIAGTDYIPPNANQLDSLWHNLHFNFETLAVEELYKKAIGLFLAMARYQFFYDVNKRMGRLMMNGVLLSCGYPAINLPAKRQLEFNQLMLAFYASGDKKAMTQFMLSCLEPRVVEIMSE